MTPEEFALWFNTSQQRLWQSLDRLDDAISDAEGFESLLRTQMGSVDFDYFVLGAAWMHRRYFELRFAHAALQAQRFQLTFVDAAAAPVDEYYARMLQEVRR